MAGKVSFQNAASVGQDDAISNRSFNGPKIRPVALTVAAAILRRQARQDDGAIWLSPPIVALWLVVWRVLAACVIFGAGWHGKAAVRVANEVGLVRGGIASVATTE